MERLRSPILVGRERELELLLEAAARPPAFAIVEGEAGIGKTRLVEELLRNEQLTGRPTYVGACQQLSEPFPLGPVVEALREARLAWRSLPPVAGALRPLLPELAARLPEAPEDPRGGGAPTERRRLALLESSGRANCGFVHAVAVEGLQLAREQLARAQRL